MSEIDELQRRILSAMDRVAQGLDGLNAADPAEADALRQELADEKSINAELKERIDTLSAQHEKILVDAEKKVAGKMTDLDTQLQKLRRINAQLVEACDALRKANAEGVGDPDLINATMTSELEAIRTMRDAEMAEAGEIIAALTPLLDEAAAAAGNGSAQ
ncbi:hypothetical protein [uncultured Roseobacter sp.]|uniref:hypothetical protein n=1 Tax=uncultured Roseobacter sp. TaxID=114847 RepID=UPI00262C4A21|nr:hypothetical protein [uncultured Roseobacter sp.]